jgi:hypothetical protein
METGRNTEHWREDLFPPQGFLLILLPRRRGKKWFLEKKK